MRSIPATMATQHPDNASRPYWNSRSYISTSNEIRECFLCFSDLNIDEYNWDWEGKFVDEAVVDRLLHKHLQYFKDNPLGEKKFLTFRLPNPRVEKQFRLARAFMVIVTSSQFAESLGFTHPPIFETILPLTETAEEILDIQEAFKMLVAVDHKLLKMKDSLQHIEIIPLFEKVEDILNSADIISRYLKLHKQAFYHTPKHLRPYCARSDPALNAGIVPTMLAIRVALSNYRTLENESGVKMYPMVGTGCLPFRGGVNPLTIEDALISYAGAATLTVQSAFRYDYSQTLVRKAIDRIKKSLQTRPTAHVDKSQIQLVRKIVPEFIKPYHESIEMLAPLINHISSQIVRRRERVQHVGLFGYSRGLGSVTLPRAIPFTASLYTLGIPPELIATGQGLRTASKLGIVKEILALYPMLKNDMINAGYFLDKQSLSKLKKHVSGMDGIIDDIRFIEQVLTIELGPVDPAHFEHRQIVRKAFDHLEANQSLTDLITRGGIYRKSLG